MALVDVPIAKEKDSISNKQTYIWSWVITFQEMKIASVGVCVYLCVLLCVFGFARAVA